LNNSDLKETFQSAGVTFSISKNEVTSKLVASYNFEPDVAYFTENMMSSAIEDDDHDLVEFKINDNNPIVNKNYLEAFISIKKDFNSVLMGISRKINNEYKIFKNPLSDMKILAGDFLILLVDGKSKKTLVKEFGETEGRHEI
jgi:voltage-gated potassium channel